MTEQIFTDFSSASLPIILLIFCGYCLKRWMVRDEAAWASIDTLNFQVLIPALIMGTISQADILGISAWAILVCIALVLVALSIILGIVYWLVVPSMFEKEAFSSVFQTSTRWNASIALVVVASFFDATAVAVVAVVMVGLMPLVNAINITVLVKLHNKSDSMLMTTIISVLKNPIILGCIVGIAFALLSVSLPPAVQNSIDLLGQASIATVLLSLGAGLKISQISGNVTPIALSTFLKLIAMPSLVYALGSGLGIAHGTLVIMTVATAMPTAMNGYVVAKKMGGDAPLYASCGTVQTLLSFVTVPLYVVALL